MGSRVADIPPRGDDFPRIRLREPPESRVDDIPPRLGDFPRIRQPGQPEIRVGDIPTRRDDIPRNKHPDPSESQEEGMPVGDGAYPCDIPTSGEEDVLRGWVDISINSSHAEVKREGDISTALNFLLGNEGDDRSHLIREENSAIGEVLSRSSPRPRPSGGFLPPAKDGSPTDNADIAEVTSPPFDRNSEVYDVDSADLGRPFGFDSDVAQETDGVVSPRV